MDVSLNAILYLSSPETQHGSRILAVRKDNTDRADATDSAEFDLVSLFGHTFVPS
jgi:hypothetical protein